MRALKPCPFCQRAPTRFFVGRGVEVIACPIGCQADWNTVVTHITSVMIEGQGWGDLGDAWNTIEVYQRDGRTCVRFDQRPPGSPVVEYVGKFLEWSPAISRSHARERAAEIET